MRVGIITMYYTSKNCGGLLQAFALCKALRNMGYEAEQVCYIPKNITNKSLGLEKKIKRYKIMYWGLNMRKVSSLIWTLIRSGFTHYQERRLTKKMNMEGWKSKVLDQSSVFQKFEEEITHSKEVYDESNLDNLNEVYDAFITGSDQVWHTTYFPFRGYFLDFVVDKVCVAYAVSTGKINNIPFEEKILKDHLKNFEKIGVREKSFAKKLIKDFGVNVQITSDPVFLLGVDEWTAVENSSVVPDKRYIFVYFLGDQKWHREYVAQFAKKKKLSVIHMPYISGKPRYWDMLLGNEGRYDVGPREFLALIHHADYIFTDSFHAMAFSTLYQKNYYIFDRCCEDDSMNFRIDDFLEEYNMEWRKIKNSGFTIDESKNNYKDVMNRIQVKKGNSIVFLREQLNQEK